MFALCDSMKWNHLPIAGGLYDQSPDLLDKFKVIFSERNKEEERQQQEQERKHRQSSRVAGRRR